MGMDNYQKKGRSDRGWGTFFIQGQRSMTFFKITKIGISRKEYGICMIQVSKCLELGKKMM